MALYRRVTIAARPWRFFDSGDRRWLELLEGSFKLIYKDKKSEIGLAVIEDGKVK